MAIGREQRMEDQKNTKSYDGAHCFSTTGVIDLYQGCLKVTQILVDSGAANTFISRAAVNQAGFYSFKVRAKRFELADGSITVRDEKVRFDLFIAGVMNRVEAFVDDSEASWIILFGCDAQRQFCMKTNASFGPRKEWKITVAENLTGMGLTRRVVQRDPPGLRARMQSMSRAAGLTWAQQEGKRIERSSRSRNTDPDVNQVDEEEDYWCNQMDEEESLAQIEQDDLLTQMEDDGLLCEEGGEDLLEQLLEESLAYEREDEDLHAQMELEDLLSDVEDERLT